MGQAKLPRYLTLLTFYWRTKVHLHWLSFHNNEIVQSADLRNSSGRRLSYVVDTMATDALATQGARLSVTMVFTYFLGIFQSQHQNYLKFLTFIAHASSFWGQISTHPHTTHIQRSLYIPQCFHWPGNIHRKQLESDKAALVLNLNSLSRLK